MTRGLGAAALVAAPLVLAGCDDETGIKNPFTCIGISSQDETACYQKLKYEALIDGRVYLEMPDGSRIRVFIEKKGKTGEQESE